MKGAAGPARRCAGSGARLPWPETRDNEDTHRNPLPPSGTLPAGRRCAPAPPPGVGGAELGLKQERLGALVWPGGSQCVPKVALGSPRPSLFPPPLGLPQPVPGAQRGCVAGSRRPFMPEAPDIQRPPAGPRSGCRDWDLRQPGVACWPLLLFDPSCILLSCWRCHLARHRL